MAGAMPYAKAHSSGLNQPAVAHRDPASSLLEQLGGGGRSCFVERYSVFFISPLVLWPPTEA